MTLSGVSRVGAGRGRPHQGHGNGLGSEEQFLLPRWGGESCWRGGACMQEAAGGNVFFAGISCMVWVAAALGIGRGASGGEMSLGSSWVTRGALCQEAWICSFWR